MLQRHQGEHLQVAVEPRLVSIETHSRTESVVCGQGGSTWRWSWRSLWLCDDLRGRHPGHRPGADCSSCTGSYQAGMDLFWSRMGKRLCLDEILWCGNPSRRKRSSSEPTVLRQGTTWTTLPRSRTVFSYAGEFGWDSWVGSRREGYQGSSGHRWRATMGFGENASGFMLWCSVDGKNGH